jgi:hypothetical protein
MALDTSIASQPTQEEKGTACIQGLQDGTILSQRKKALIYNVQRTTLQQRLYGRRFTKESGSHSRAC